VFVGILIGLALVLGMDISQRLRAVFVSHAQVIEAGTLRQNIAEDGATASDRFEASFVHFRTDGGVQCIAIFSSSGAAPSRTHSPTGASCGWWQHSDRQGAEKRASRRSCVGARQTFTPAARRGSANPWHPSVLALIVENLCDDTH
jgi:hypothetical protein